MSHARIPTLCILLLAASLPQAQAQDAALQPGEAFVTRFAGTAGANGRAVINPNGTVGSIIDLRMPRRPPQGQHWVDEPQRNPVTAAEVGQVFGVALDEGPNVFVAATAAFGLHRTPDNAQWMPGMWGPGGPGGVYVLERHRGYRPRVLAQIGLSGRPNSGAALGNIAYDKWHKQLFVSDLETGMIHRLRAADGADGGYYDHGTQGRANFLDAENKQPRSMTPIAFDPNSGARIADCQGKFDLTPECWNVAASGRRVWGLGMRREQGSGEVRLYYAVWSSPALGNAAWNQAAEDDKRNSVWSIRLGPDGNFDPSGVRREFLLPDFFVNRRTSRGRATASRSAISRSPSAAAAPRCWSPSAAACATSGSRRTIRSPIRTRRARCATSFIRTGCGGRSGATTSASITGRRTASPSCARTAPAARPSGSAIPMPGSPAGRSPISSCGSAATRCARPTGRATCRRPRRAPRRRPPRPANRRRPWRPTRARRATTRRCTACRACARRRSTSSRRRPPSGPTRTMAASPIRRPGRASPI